MKEIEHLMMQDQLNRHGSYRLEAEIHGRFSVTVLVQLLDGEMWGSVSKTPCHLAISEKALLSRELGELGIRARL